MITEQDLQAAIAECQGQRNPNASTCLKLAAYYTIHDKMFGHKDQAVRMPEATYSYSPEPLGQVGEVTYLSDTEFSKAVYGRNQNDVLSIMDELMTVLQMTNPRLYNGVMRKIIS